MSLICKLFFSEGFPVTFNFGARKITTQAYPLQFKTSPSLWSEPLKKKKKIDPAILKVREERKKKRLMKEIRKLEKLNKPLKPIADWTIPDCIEKEPEKRRRIVAISEEVTEERILLMKKWAAFKLKESISDFKTIQRIIKAQEKALSELQLESEELYQAALKIDQELIPYKFKGPTETPPAPDYHFPDGSFTDVSKKWD